MKRLFTLLALTLFITTGACAQQTPNFAGTYLINKSKIDFGDLPEYVLQVSINIIQDNDQFIITRNSVDDKGRGRTLIDTITLGGKPFHNIAIGGLSRTISAKWNDEKTAIVIHSDSRKEDHTAGVMIDETWSLVEDGQTLDLQRKVVQADGAEYVIRGYYDRQ